ncbi:protein STRUBBELIG-RECEPTOR FAMILY 5-like, partial [Trifolium medium]|nr:protein STRUBBELIG-RECEPTOR FAMILY 5-like [Trifolium medium]
RLLGEGSIGPVYRAKYADGKVFAVKKINPSLLDGGSPEEFSQIVTSTCKLRHPNIAEQTINLEHQSQNCIGNCSGY